MFICKDQLTNYLIAGHVHLSKKDYGFFSNLKNLIVTNKSITSNQTKLFDKLIVKYKRQLQKLNIDVDATLNLPWHVLVVETKQEFLDAYVSIDNTTIQIRSPFNNKFINALRRAEYSLFKWDKTKRIYEAPFSTFQLKLGIGLVKDCYESVKFCSTIQRLIAELEEYQLIKYWNPTLVKRHNHFYILGMNTFLHDAIADIELNDHPITLFKLSQYGVKIDDDILQDDFRKFAGNFMAEIDSADFGQLSEWLRLLNIDCVFTSRDLVYNKEISHELKSSLLENDIECKPFKHTEYKENSVLLNTHSSWTSFALRNFCKIIKLSNSRPVLIQ